MENTSLAKLELWNVFYPPNLPNLHILIRSIFLASELVWLEHNNKRTNKYSQLEVRDTFPSEAKPTRKFFVTGMQEQPTLPCHLKMGLSRNVQKFTSYFSAKKHSIYVRNGHCFHWPVTFENLTRKKRKALINDHGCLICIYPDWKLYGAKKGKYFYILVI